MKRLLLLALVAILASGSLFAAQSLTGTVVDSSGGAVAGAQVILRSGNANRNTTTDASGRFTFDDTAATDSILVVAGGFTALSADPAQVLAGNLVLEAAPVAEEITVNAPWPHVRSTTATKTDTLLRDVPQAVTVVTRNVIEQQTMQSMGDVVRYVPGVGIAQGEGNRDTPVFRGNSSTSDFFVDGVRDDVQYFRDLYNVERVEALKGPNAMIFGRGGVGGVLNRVTRQAGWNPSREVTVQGGSWGDRRITTDFGHAINDSIAARVTGMYQQSESYREGVHLDRYGINPTFAFTLGENTVLRAGIEAFHDDRTADRGVTSFGGRPVSTDPSTFFGNADLSNSKADVNIISASIDHRFSKDVTLRSRLSYADYDKFYQNVFPGAADATGTKVNVSAYSNATQRQNLFSQTDLVVTRRTGRIGHTILAGVELGRQNTHNFRATGYFASVGANVTSVLVPIASPTTQLPLTFRQSATDADNDGIATVAAVYVQDQIVISPKFHVIAGLRYDSFRVDLRNNRNAAEFASHDGLISPRAGIVYKPIEPVSLYATYSLSYLPRAGEQLSSLSASNQALDPEEFRSYETGAKWSVSDRLDLAAAVYRLDRKNVAVADPVNPTLSILVDGQRSEGVELSATGDVTETWSIVGAYAFQDGEILESLSATARAGARLAQLPRHSASLWNKVDFSRTVGAGVGVIHRGAVFTSTDNSVTVPAFTRVDAAFYYTLTERLRMQVNVENVFNTDYYASAHSNNNITPGSPRAARLNWTLSF